MPRRAASAWTTLGITVAFVTSERLYDDQRAAIERVFGCPVANGYGGRDAGFIAHQCPAGGMHITAFDNQAFDLTGPGALDHAQVAAILAQAAGREIGHQEVTPDAMRQGLLPAGLPADYAEFLLMILAAFKDGHDERITGRAPGTLAQYAQDYRAAWA